MKIINQNGFAHIMIAVAIGVVVAIGAIGYFVFARSDSKGTQNSSTTADASASAAATSKSKDETATKAAAKDHFALVYQKKFSEAYQSTCQGFKDNTSYTVFKTSLDKAFFATMDLSAVEYTSVDVRNSQAQISGSVGPVAPGSDLKVNLIKENSQWCVFGYKIE